jgi:hypothetical protein
MTDDNQIKLLNEQFLPLDSKWSIIDTKGNTTLEGIISDRTITLEPTTSIYNQEAKAYTISRDGGLTGAELQVFEDYTQDRTGRIAGAAFHLDKKCNITFIPCNNEVEQAIDTQIAQRQAETALAEVINNGGFNVVAIPDRCDKLAVSPKNPNGLNTQTAEAIREAMENAGLQVSGLIGSDSLFVNGKSAVTLSGIMQKSTSGMAR